MANWTATSGIGVTLGGGPLEGIANNFVIKSPVGKTLSATFVGAGAAWGGPASFTYADSETPSLEGNIVWRGGGPGFDALLKYPTDGFILSLGAAPLHLVTPYVGSLITSVSGKPVTANEISGGYLLVLGFGATSMPAVTVIGAIQDVTAAASVLVDIAYGQSKGYLVAGVSAYAVVPCAAKGVDLGGVSGMTGKWIFT